jgi:thimet oligopeptidase
MNRTSNFLKRATAAYALLACASLPPGAGRAAAPSGLQPTIVHWDLTNAQITSNCKARIADARAAVRTLAKRTGPRTFANTVLAFENVNSDLTDRLVAETFLSQIAPDASIRSTSFACSNLVAAFASDETADPVMYRALAAAGKSGTARTPADRALLKLWLDQFRRSGAALAPPARAEFVRLSDRLTETQNTFNENLANDKTTILVSKAQTAGLAPDFLATLRRSGRAFVVPVNDSTSPQVMDNASSEDVRKRYLLASDNLQVPANVVLLEREIALRDRLAHLLGFPNWAAYQLAPRVDPSVAHIDAFLHELDARLLPESRRDIARLAALKASSTGNAAATLEPWDVGYYLSELRKAKYALDQEEVRQYFPAPHVVTAVMGIYAKILGVEFAPVTPANAYYRDVTEFSVRDAASGRFIGTFLLDLIPRQGKPGGAYNASIVPVRRLADGRMRPPVCVMQVSDWPAPANGKPALLTHDDVVTFFHEFGHLMAAELTTTPYESLSQFQQDFVEAPSQMLENFVWNPTVLKQVSSNVRTGRPLPDATIEKMVRARCLTDRLCNAYAATRQLVFSIADLDVHSAGARVDTTAVFSRDARLLSPMPFPPGTHPAAQFGHLSSGYDAGYYTYLWSLVYAQDMFTAFQEGGLESPAVGMRYRRTILEPAHTYDPNVEVRNFLGRPVSPAAFYRGFESAAEGDG